MKANQGMIISCTLQSKDLTLIEIVKSIQTLSKMRIHGVLKKNNYTYKKNLDI